MKVAVAMATAPSGGNLAFADAALASSSQNASSLASRLARLPELDSAALREEWRRLRRAEPPRISRDLLVRAIAYGLQEREFGGLPKWARQSLAGSAAASVAEEGVGPQTPRSASPAPALKPGARLVREWHGRTHTVVVLDDAFEFEGRRYRSLTQIAREITGAHWSGPRFFGLTKRHAAAEVERVRHRAELEVVSKDARSRQETASAAVTREVSAGVEGAKPRRPTKPLREGAGY